jgi:hypothetical protein
MTDENVDWRFLGRQVQGLQSEVRSFRADQLRLESGVTAMRADIAQLRADTEGRFEHMGDRFDRLEAHVARLESEVRAGFRSVDARFDQMSQTMATNMQVLLSAMGRREGN